MFGLLLQALDASSPLTFREETMSKEVIHTALIALAAFAVVAAVQDSFKIPVVGKYLPGA